MLHEPTFLDEGQTISICFLYVTGIPGISRREPNHLISCWLSLVQILQSTNYFSAHRNEATLCCHSIENAEEQV